MTIRLLEQKANCHRARILVIETGETHLCHHKTALGHHTEERRGGAVHNWFGIPQARGYRKVGLPEEKLPFESVQNLLCGKFAHDRSSSPAQFALALPLSGATILLQPPRRRWPLMPEGSRAIDWWMLVIELLVLIVIAGEALLALRNWCNKKNKVAKIFELMAKGQQLQASAPTQQEAQLVGEWVGLVGTWQTKTNDFLRTCSPQASAAFFANFDVPTVHFAHIATGAHDYYITILVRLKNLRNVMEKPDTYY
jgi:hypothetical protein